MSDRTDGLPEPLVAVDGAMPLSFHDYFHATSSELRLQKLDKNVVRLFGPANANGETHYTIGRPAKVVKAQSFFRHSPFWLHPHSSRDKVEVPQGKQGVAIQFQRTDGTHVVLVALSGITDCTTYLHGNEEIKAYVENDSERKEDGFELLIGKGDVLEQVWANVFSHVRKGGNPAVVASDTYQLKWHQGLIYCTWNGLGLNLSHDNIVNALQDLHDNGLRITGIIIDDGWQTTDNQRRWHRFEAHEKFPIGLKGLITEIRFKFPYIIDIGVWSTIVGYWNGIVPGSELDKRFKTIDIRIGNTPALIFDIPDVERYFDEYYSFLADCGVTCVKIDHQSTLDSVNPHYERGRLWQAYQDGVWKAATKYFDGKIIYCMAMVPHIMLYGLQNYGAKESPVFRNSDDFFPTIPSSHSWHVYTNLYCSQYTRNLAAVLDYDMFQTRMGDTNFPSLHAAARAISGGPVYFTDSPGVHNLDLIRSFSPQDSSGRNVLLTLQGSPTLLDPYHDIDSARAVWTVTRHNGAKIYGVFNLSQTKVQEKFDCQGAGAVRTFKSKGIHHGENIELSLGICEWDIITTIPLFSQSARSKHKIGYFGILDHLVGVAAVDTFDINWGSDRVVATAKVKALGKYGFYLKGFKSAKFSVNGSRATAGDIHEGMLTVNLTREQVPLTKDHELISLVMVAYH